MRKILGAALSILSLSVSVCFLWAAWLLLFDSETDFVMFLFGCIAGIYGSCSAFLLGAAWLIPAKSQSPAMRWLAVAALVGLVGASLDVGMISGLEWALILVVGAILWGQSYLLRRIVKYALANKTLQPTR